jgi:asparagine synthase (glutamine-hydrolysing)
MLIGAKPCLTRLVGMFAFCILDTATNTLFLARDFFGIKPLYYLYKDGTFAFASEMKALLCLPGVRTEACPETTYSYLYYGVTDHSYRTFFMGIYQLLPAHCMTIDLNHPS